MQFVLIPWRMNEPLRYVYPATELGEAGIRDWIKQLIAPDPQGDEEEVESILYIEVSDPDSDYIMADDDHNSSVYRHHKNTRAMQLANYLTDSTSSQIHRNAVVVGDDDDEFYDVSDGTIQTIKNLFGNIEGPHPDETPVDLGEPPVIATPEYVPPPPVEDDPIEEQTTEDNNV